MSDLDRHDHAHGEESTLTDIQKRVKALESILVSKGLVERAVIDQIIEHFERRVGPHVGARVVARAWTDQQFKRALLEDATKAINLQSDLFKLFSIFINQHDFSASRMKLCCDCAANCTSSASDNDNLALHCRRFCFA